jgi:hypothetical protein
MSDMADRWFVAKGKQNGKPVLIRGRQDLRKLGDINIHSWLLIAEWRYQSDDRSGLPTEETNEAMQRFEDAMATTLEEQSLGYLFCVRVHDGLRRWLAYASDAGRARQVVEGLCDGARRFPVAVILQRDPDWQEYATLLASVGQAEDAAEHADDFWQWFAERAARLRRTDEREAAEEIEERLAELDSRLGIEISADDNVRELTITAGGDRDVFVLAKRVASIAPTVVGWSVRALKPPMGFDFEIEVGGRRLDAKRLFFDAVSVSDLQEENGICVYVPSAVANREEITDVVTLILETGLGEELASAISFLDIKPLSDKNEHSAPLADLVDYVRAALAD